MAADRHRHSLRNPATNHIANSSSAKVVEDQAGVVELLVLPDPRALSTDPIPRLFAPCCHFALNLTLTVRANHLSYSGRAADIRPGSAKIPHSRSSLARENELLSLLACDALLN